MVFQIHIIVYSRTRLCPYGLYYATLSPLLILCLFLSYVTPRFPYLSSFLLPPTQHPQPLNAPFFLTCLLQTQKNQPLLLPPPLRYPQYLPPLCLHKNVQNGSGHILLRGCIMYPGDVDLHLLQAYRPYSLLQLGLFPDTVLLEPFLPPQNQPHHLVMGSSHKSPNVKGS